MNEEQQLDSKKAIEERGMRRFPISASAYFQWKGPDDNWHESTGITQNISARGVFILARRLPPLGGAVEVTVDIPPVNPSGTARGQLRGKGIVTRVAPETGFAAEVFFQVLRVDKARTS